MLDQKQAKMVATLGKFSHPANKRYGNQGTVNCDFCNLANLVACIGYEQYDICLKCADDILKTPVTSISQLAREQSSQIAHTRMMVEHTRPTYHAVTNMMADHTRRE